jgi:alcohol dehydrogenase YqhD (iron-dependent ADH family)
MSNSVPLTEKQVEKLWDIDKKKNIVEKATDKQKNYLKRLGFEGDIDELTKSQASIEINKLRNSM